MRKSVIVPERKNTDESIIKKSKEELKFERKIKTIADAIEEARKNVTTLLGQYPCVIIQDEATLTDYIDACIKNNEVAIDTETTGLNVYRDKLVGISLYTEGKTEAYIPLNHIDYRTGLLLPNQLPVNIVAKEINRLNPIDTDMHHANFDLRFLRRYGMNLQCTFDVLIAGWLLNENEKHGLKDLYKKYILKGKEDTYSANKLLDLKIITFADIPIEIAGVYAAHDARITMDMKRFQARALKSERLKGVANVFYNIEMPLVTPICDMEDRGMKLDDVYHTSLSKEYNDKLNEALTACYDEIDKIKDKIDEWRKSPDATDKPIKKDEEGNDIFIPVVYNKNGTIKKGTGVFAYEKSKSEQLKEPITLSSPTQVAILLYDILKVPVIDSKSPRGTGVAILEQLDIPFAKKLTEYRAIEKLVSSFITPLKEEASIDGRVHTNLNQNGAKTGRFSSSDPNLQNIPSKNKDIRKLFIADTLHKEINSSKFMVEDTTELFNGNEWVCVRNLKVGDKIEDKVITDIKKFDNRIGITLGL